MIHSNSNNSCFFIINSSARLAVLFHGHFFCEVRILHSCNIMISGVDHTHTKKTLSMHFDAFTSPRSQSSFVRSLLRSFFGRSVFDVSKLIISVKIAWVRSCVCMFILFSLVESEMLFLFCLSATQSSKSNRKHTN